MKKWVVFAICILTVNIAFGQVFDTVSYYKKYSPKQLHQDLDFLLKKFEEIHPNYFSETPKDTVICRYNILKSRITKPMTRIDFMNLFAPVVYHVIKDGHNYVDAGDTDLKLFIDSGGKLFPIPVKISQGKLLVNSTTAEIPYRAEIISINKLASPEIINNVLSCYNPENHEYEENFMSDDFSKLYWFNYGGFKQYEINYISSPDKSISNITLLGRIPFKIDQLRSYQKTKNYLFYELPEINAGIIQYNACEDLTHFRPFCDSVFSIMKKKQCKNLVIDIRTNEGGTTRLNDILFEYLTNKPIAQYTEIETKVSKDEKKSFIAHNRKYAGWFKWYNYLYYPIYIRLNKSRKQTLTAKNGTFTKRTSVPVKPQENLLRFNGNIYLLTSKSTYSSAVFFAAAFKCYQIGTIIGQETGEPTCFTGDWVGVTLPNTKLECAISAHRFVLACGKCDGHGVIPDYTIDDSKITDNLLDPEMDFVKRLIQNKK